MRIARYGRGERGVARARNSSCARSRSGCRRGFPATARAGRDLPDLVPAHVGDLEARLARLLGAGEGEHLARQDARGPACRPRRCARRASAGRCTARGRASRPRPPATASPRPLSAQAFHAVGHGPLARERRPGRPRGSRRGSDVISTRAAGATCASAFCHRAKVAHAVVDDRDALCHGGPGRAPAAESRLEGSLGGGNDARRRADRAPPPCAARARTP